MTESTLRSFSSSGRGVDLIPLLVGDKRKFEEGGFWGGNRCEMHPGACGMTESTLRSFSSSGRGVDLIPLGDKRKFEEGGVWGGNRCEMDPEAVNSGFFWTHFGGQKCVKH